MYIGHWSSNMNAGILTDTPTAEKQTLTTSHLPAIEIRGTTVCKLNQISLFNFSYYNRPNLKDGNTNSTQGI